MPFVENALKTLSCRIAGLGPGDDIVTHQRLHPATAILLEVRGDGSETFALCRRLRALPQGRGTPILFLSEAEPPREIELEGYRAGGSDFLAKHIDAEILHAKISQILELDRSRANLQNFFMNAPAPMVVMQGAEHRYVMANEPYKKMVGQQDLVGRTVLEVFREEDVGGFLKIIDEVLRTGKPFIGKEMPLRLTRPDGTRGDQFVNVGYYPSVDAEGNIVGIISMHLDVTEEVRARRFLEESKNLIETERENFRNLFRQTPEMVCILKGPDHVFEFVNEAHIRALGFDATGLPVREAQPESVEVHGILDNVYRTGETAHLHEIPVTLTDRLRYFNLTYAARHDEFGRINGVMILGAEVSGEVTSRELLRESQERLKFAVASAKMGTWEVRLPSNKVVLSAEAQRIFGFEREYESSDEAIDVLIHPEDRQRAREVLAAAIAGHTLYDDEYRIVRPDGEVRWLNTRGRAIYNADGSPAMLTGVTVDITERKRQAETLEQKTALLETIIENIPMGVVFAEAPSGRLIFANKRYKKVWRQDLIPAADIEGYSAYTGFHDDGRRYDVHEWPLARALREGEVIFNEEIGVHFGDGTRGVLSLSAAPVRDSEGRIIAGVVLSEDVTERKNAEERLHLAKEEAERANELKSAFLANMSHEIRTPLGAMIGFAELLRDPGLPPTEHAGYADIIKRNGEQLSELINDVLEFSKIEAGYTTMELIPMRPAEVAGGVVSLLQMKAKEKNITLDFVADPSTPVDSVSDPTRVRQVLVNLVGNAVKFTANGGVRIRSFALEREGKRLVAFEVKDTGIGISEEQRGRIFDVFVQGDGSMTRKFGGTGLGLALSRRLAHALGGDVALQSSSASGSSFLFTFLDHADHARTTEAPKAETSANKPDRRLDGVSVLVVDDSPDNRTLMSHFLVREGARVESAENGIEAVEQALSGEHEVVLMDIQMPVMDGYTATQTLRQKGYRKPIIAITAHAMSEVRDRCESAGCTDQLPKPIRPEDLVAAVARHSNRTAVHG